jgi:hypothetical protein
VGKGVWGAIKGVPGVVALPWNLGKAIGNKSGELIAIVVYDGANNAYLQVIDDIGNIPTQFQSTGAQFAMMKQIFEQQGNSEGWNRLIGETGGEYISNLIPLGAIKHVGKIVPIAKGALQTSRNLAIAGRLSLAEVKLLNNAKELLTIPYANVSKSTSILESFGVKSGIAYRAIHPDFAESTILNGFYRSGLRGRLGNDGIYANNTVKGAIAEFQHHNSGVTPVVFEVNYPLSTPLQIDPPSGYFAQPLPFTQGANILVAPSVRAAGTTNLLIRQGARVGSRIP